MQVESTIIGIDAATENSSTGLVLAKYNGEKISFESVWERSIYKHPVDQIKVWIEGKRKVILAIDSPMGWPVSFAEHLKNHKAGKKINIKTKDFFFYRRTDLFLKKEFKNCGLKLGPFSVASDKIGRTAFRSLQLIDEINNATKRNFKLVTNSKDDFDYGIIEVYPSATLKSYKMIDFPYKAKHWNDTTCKNCREEIERIEIDKKLLESIQLLESIHLEHDLDAFICCLAARDYLNKDIECYKPECYKYKPEEEEEEEEIGLNDSILETEGWIWVKKIPST